MGVLNYLPSDESFLAPVNLTHPNPSSQEGGWVTFIYLAWTCIALHKFISFLGLCKGKVGIVILFLDLIFASFSKGLVIWFDPFLLDNEAFWYLSPDWLGFN